MSTTETLIGQSLAGVAGRGLFYGETGANGRRNIYSEANWNAICQQARTWGIAVVHPKVADGPNWWYTASDLQMLSRVASMNGLKCYPYHYCYGNTDGSSVEREAAICATIGSLCGGVCPDIEIEWERAGVAGQSWAIEFGKIVRASFRGPVLPTLFGNPSDHAGFPYAQVLAWSSGWMPMAYFSEWSDSTTHRQMTAEQAVTHLYGQWVMLNKQLASRNIAPPPILPLIELGQSLPASEVASFLQQMKGYGYCGFWYAGSYPAYAEAILAAPNPAWPQQKTSVPVATIPTTEPPVEMSKPTVGIVEVPHPIVVGVQQNLSAEELAISWKIVNANLPYVVSDPIALLWMDLMQAAYGIGAPIGPKQRLSDGTVQVQEFEGGRIFYTTAGIGKVWVQSSCQARTAGTIVGANPVSL